jgi:hypothetical protein
MTYLADLEVIWQCGKDQKKRREKPSSVNLLTGLHLAKVLSTLSLGTGDERFEHAISALREHGFIDDQENNVLRWEPFVASSVKLSQQAEKFRSIKLLLANGLSFTRACAETVAKYGHPGNSFDAAIKDLKLRYKDGPGTIDEWPDGFADAMAQMLKAIPAATNSRKLKDVLNGMNEREGGGLVVTILGKKPGKTA